MLNESVSTDPLAFQVLSYDNPMIKYIFLVSFMLPKINYQIVRDAHHFQNSFFSLHF